LYLYRIQRVTAKDPLPKIAFEVNAMAELFAIQNIDDDVLQAECERVFVLLRSLLPSIEIHPVGSTAVPGVVGKQDIDLLVRVPASQFETTQQTLDAHFARNPDQLSTDDFQGYHVESPFDVAIQLTIADGPYDNFLAFLSALRSDPAIVDAYNALKRQWNGRPMEEYRQAKHDFIQAVLSRT
jgi:GrpB-like predicted nucleotidyltransferase (UPF0157 family)